MIITLTKDKFINNIFTQLSDGGCTIIFNVVQEHCTSDYFSDCIVDSINIEVRQEISGKIYFLSCPCIIGMGNEFITINSNYEELLGKPLTLDNIDKCSFEITNESMIKYVE